LLRHESRAASGRRGLLGRPREWEWNLRDIHGAKWYDLASCRASWRQLGVCFVQAKRWKEGKDLLPLDVFSENRLAPAFRAKFFSLVGELPPGFIAGLQLLLVGRREAWDLARGKARSGFAWLDKRLQQAMYLIEALGQARVEEASFIEEEFGMCGELASAAARTSCPMKAWERSCAGAAGTIAAYWSSTVHEGVGGIAAAVLSYPVGDIVPRITAWAAVPVPGCTDRRVLGGMALYMVLEFLLHGVGSTLVADTRCLEKY
jgi:hypothetical protein